MHCGFMSREVFEALGFRTVVPRDMSVLANPVGLDGVFQAYCPPYFGSMDAAVDAALASYSRDGQGMPAQTASPMPYLKSMEEHRSRTLEISEEGIACTKAVCNYVYDTYGRFPGSTDAMHLMWFIQAHHIDTDFYDSFFRNGAYGPKHAAHMRIWHG
jgi:hypothetical protein